MTEEQAKTMGASPKPIMDLGTAYWGSMVLLSLNELGLFALLADGPAPCATLADKAGVSGRALGFLLDAGVGLGVLRRVGESYANTPAGEVFLVPGSPANLGGGMRYLLDIYEAWGKLPDAVRTDTPQLPAETYLGGDEERTRRFVYGMHHRAQGMARGIAGAVQLEGDEHLLDLGGGSGAYTIFLCQRHPELRSTLLELPGVLAVAKEIVTEAGVAERVTFRPGSYHEDAYGEGYDAALLSGILHRETEADCLKLMQRTFAALRPGGRIFVADVMFDESGHEPLFASLFALNMLLTAPGGGAHSSATLAEALAEAGFEDVAVQVLAPPATHTVISARKPGAGA